MKFASEIQPANTKRSMDSSMSLRQQMLKAILSFFLDSTISFFFFNFTTVRGVLNLAKTKILFTVAVESIGTLLDTFYAYIIQKIL